MGTFMGHFLPGFFFLAFSVWWSFCILSRYYRAKYRKGPAYHTTGTFLCSCCCARCGKFQWEGLLKIVCCTVGLVGEIITGFNNKGQFINIGNGQHATMFSFFGFSGVIDMMLYCQAPLPKYTDYAFTILCFVVEGVLFHFHLHGRSQVDIVLHTLLVYVIACCVATLIAEIKFPNSVLPAMARCFFIGLQGTWFIQVGAMLYPPFPGMKQFETGDMHANVMISTIIFGWHMFGVFFSQVVMSLLISRYYSKGTAGHNGGQFRPLGSEDREVSMERLINSSGHGGDCDLSDLEESETEFDVATGGGSGVTVGHNGRLLLKPTAEP